jgi:hypothetical protein
MSRRRKSGAVHVSRLPKGIRQAAAWRIEKLQQRGPTSDLMFTPEKALAKARQREVVLHYLEEGTGPLGPRVERLASVCRVTSRTIRHWLSRYRDNPGRGAVVARLRDRGISTLRDGSDVTPPPGVPRSPRPTRPLAIVQIDHTLIDIMVVDECNASRWDHPNE